MNQGSKGLGVFLNEDAQEIAKGTAVLQYKGVIITGSESDRRAAVYANEQTEGKSGQDTKGTSNGALRAPLASLVTNSLADAGGRRDYMFEMKDVQIEDNDIKENVVIDAHKKGHVPAACLILTSCGLTGGFARMINHHCEPNLEAELRWVNGLPVIGKRRACYLDNRIAVCCCSAVCHPNDQAWT